MEVTIVKKVNGVEIHPAYTTSDRQEIPMKAITTYRFEVAELDYLDRRHLDLMPLLTTNQKSTLDQMLVIAQGLVDANT